jgi:L-amino acid N-acyltransferase YncA
VSNVRVRAATAADAAAICRIYNEGIEDRVATLETELRTPEERAAWLASKSPRHPVIVAETMTEATKPIGAGAEPGTASTTPIVAGAEPIVAGAEPIVAGAEPGTISNSPPTARAASSAVATIIGWGSLNQFNPRDAYRHVVDFSIYVDRAYRGHGVGKVMLTRLIELAREHRFHKMVLSAFPTNNGGMALYERMGFRTVGIYKEQGMLDGRWVDTIIMEKLL